MKIIIKPVKKRCFNFEVVISKYEKFYSITWSCKGKGVVVKTTHTF